jgi:hypothetical protein
MNDIFIKSIVFLMVVLILGLCLAPFKDVFDSYIFEGFKGYKRYKSDDVSYPGLFPISVDKPILNDFPLIGGDQVSTKNSSDIWWEYPSFGVGSFKQLTNNIRYNRNPDNGTCSRAEFCNAIYNNKRNQTNVITPLPPAQEGSGARVGYYRSEPNDLFFSIPTNENILY